MYETEFQMRVISLLEETRNRLAAEGSTDTLAAKLNDLQTQLTALAGALATGGDLELAIQAIAAATTRSQPKAGRLGVHYWRFAAAANVGDAVTATDGVTLETWTASAGGAGAGEFDQSGGTAAACATSLAAKINGLAGSLMRAIAVGHVVVAFAKTTALGNLTVTENTAGARIVRSGAAQTGSTAAADKNLLVDNYAVTAADVTSMAPGGAGQEIVIATIPSTATPKLGPVQFRKATGEPAAVTAANYPAVRLLQQGANEWCLLLKEAGAAASLAATDVVSFSIVY